MLADCTEKLCRIDSLLLSIERASGRQRPHEQSLVGFYRSQVNRILEFLRFSVREFLNGQTSFPLYVATCYDIYRYFHVLHQELRFLVSFPSPPPEIYTLVEAFFPRDKFPQFEPTAVYINSYNFFELNAVEYFGAVGLPLHSAPDRVVIVLPYADYANPLMWCALAHEMGHALEKKGNIAKEMFPTDLPAAEFRILRNWAKEFAADLVGLKLMGAAYMNAFLGLLLTRHPSGFVPTRSHPQPHTRLRLMAAYLNEKNILAWSAAGYKRVFDDILAAYGIGEISGDHTFRRRCTACGREVEENVPVLPMTRDDLWDLVRRTLEANVDYMALPQYDDMEATVVPKLVELLGRNQPIPSYRTDDIRETMNILAPVVASEEARRELSREQAIALIGRAQETPATASQILNAGWDYRWASAVSTFAENFRGRDVSAMASTYRDLLTNADYRLQKSLESALLHKILKP